MSLFDFENLQRTIDRVETHRFCGRVLRASGVLVEAVLPKVAIGTACDIELGDGKSVQAEVIGFREGVALLILFGEVHGIGEGCVVVRRQDAAMIPLGDELLGRVVDANMNPVDAKSPPKLNDKGSVNQDPPVAMSRRRIQDGLVLGIRSIDAFATIAEGQRMGVMASPGVGKSTLLGMIARTAEADVIVVALVGERGREVREFVEGELGDEGLKRSVVVVATSDQSPLQRVRAAKSATTVAEYFRAKGKSVLLLVDSLSRVAMAQREIGLAAGEPPTSKGYPPSVFAVLPRLLERAGNDSGPGSITALYSVLTEGSGIVDPVAEIAMASLDGHLQLSESLANRGHFPAIDILRSISRSMNGVIGEEHKDLARRGREALAIYEESADLVEVGAYTPGTNIRLDNVLKHIDSLNAFLRQKNDERSAIEGTLEMLSRVLPPEPRFAPLRSGRAQPSPGGGNER